MIDYHIQDPLAQPTQSNIIALPSHVTLHLAHTPYQRHSVLLYIYNTTYIVYSHIVYADCRRFSLSLRGVIISLCRYFHVLRTGARLFAKIASKWNAGAMWHAAIYFHLRLRVRLRLRLWLRAPYRFLIVAKLCPKWSIENQIVCSILHNAQQGKAAGRQLQVACVRCLSLLCVARSLPKSFATDDFTRLSS